MRSLRSIVVGCVFGILFSGAAMYAGHKTGIIDGGNIPATILAFGALSLVLGRRPTLEDGNLVQTTSSAAAVMSISGGCIGPVAALAIAGESISLPLVIAWGIAVGIVGTLIAIPLRAAFVDRSALPFPSGTATAEILENIYNRARGATSHLRMLMIGGATSFAFAMARSFGHWIPEDTSFPVAVGAIPAEAIGFGVEWSPLLVAIGFLAGVRTAISLLVGSALAWIVIAPQLVDAHIAEPDYLSLVNWLLWCGTGLMLGGAVTGIVNAWRDVRASLRSVSPGSLQRRDAILLAIASLGVIVFGVLAFDVPPYIPMLGLALSAILAAAAARAMGETDNTPAGPLGGFGQVVIGAVAPGGIHAPLSGGGVVNGTLMQSSMMLQNWKTGALVGTAPRKQLVASLVGAVVGAIACAVFFVLIKDAYGLGNEAIPAPAALSWKATAEVVEHGISHMPRFAPYGALAGLVLGIVLALPKLAKYAPSPVAMGMAFILPPYLSITMAVGGFAYGLIARRSKTVADEHGLALASGFIGGEAIAGLLIAALILLGVHV